jgi:hypothetical protein
MNSGTLASIRKAPLSTARTTAFDALAKLRRAEINMLVSNTARIKFQGISYSLELVTNSPERLAQNHPGADRPKAAADPPPRNVTHG